MLFRSKPPVAAVPVVPAIAEETEVVEAEITDEAVDAEKEDD